MGQFLTKGLSVSWGGDMKPGSDSGGPQADSGVRGT